MKTQEGLAVYNEVKHLNLNTLKYLIRYLISIWTSKQYDIKTIYDRVNKILSIYYQSQSDEMTDEDISDKTLVFINRFFRSLSDGSIIHFPKDIIYIDGFDDIENLYKQHKENLSFLFTGLVGIKHIEELKKLGLYYGQDLMEKIKGYIASIRKKLNQYLKTNRK